MCLQSSPFSLYATSREAKGRSLEKYRRERAPFGLDPPWRADPVEASASPGFQPGYFPSRCNPRAGGICGARAGALHRQWSLREDSGLQLGLKNVPCSERNRKVADHHRSAAHQRVLPDPFNEVRDPQQFQASSPPQRLDAFTGPHGWLLCSRNRGGGSEVFHGEHPRPALPVGRPPNGVVAQSLLLLLTHGRRCSASSVSYVCSPARLCQGEPASPPREPWYPDASLCGRLGLLPRVQAACSEGETQDHCPSRGPGPGPEPFQRVMGTNSSNATSGAHHRHQGRRVQSTRGEASEDRRGSQEPDSSISPPAPLGSRQASRCPGMQGPILVPRHTCRPLLLAGIAHCLEHQEQLAGQGQGDQAAAPRLGVVDFRALSAEWQTYLASSGDNLHPRGFIRLWMGSSPRRPPSSARFLGLQDRNQHVTFKELKAVRYAVESFLPHIVGRNVLLHEDNLAVVAVLTHLTTRSPDMMLELRKLWFLLDTHGIHIRPRYIRFAANIWADSLSRELDSSDWSVAPKVFRYLDRIWGPHSVDRFASMENALLARYNSKWKDPDCEAVDSLHLSDSCWARDVNWCYPPWELLDELVVKLRRSGAAATVIAPLWPGSSWHQQLVELAEEVITYPPSHDLFYPSRRSVHEGAVLPRWSMAAFKVPCQVGPTSVRLKC